MKTLKERIAIEQAFSENTLIEWRPLSGTMAREDLIVELNDAYVFLWRENDYRIKQDPMEFWVNVYKGNFLSDRYASKEAAENGKSFADHFIKTIKVREVTE